MDINTALEIMKKWGIIILFVATIILTVPKMFEYPIFKANILEQEDKSKSDISS